jgi:hypothetical protein
LKSGDPGSVRLAKAADVIFQVKDFKKQYDDQNRADDQTAQKINCRTHTILLAKLGRAARR